jgi:hypothetical protein
MSGRIFDLRFLIFDWGGHRISPDWSGCGEKGTFLLPHGKMLPVEGWFEGDRCLKINVTQGLWILEKEKARPKP